MKDYLTPSMEVVNYEQVDIVTASVVNFKVEWLEKLNLGLGE